MINFTNEELETIINMSEGKIHQKAHRLLFSRLATNDHRLWKKIYFSGDEFWVNGYNLEEILTLRIRDSYQMRGLIGTAIALKEKGDLLVLEVDDDNGL